MEYRELLSSESSFRPALTKILVYVDNLQT
jgi:hypothetical protein